MTPYSIDLRQKIVAALARGVGSQRTVAELFGVSLSFVERLLQRQRTTGTLRHDLMLAALHAVWKKPTSG
jgi:transposase